tara:strand:- start:74235 stop:74732 length:498 start_codon:yes stop_codon:yes gene_type:complete
MHSNTKPFSALAKEKLLGSGISEKIAKYAGMYSVDYAKEELHDEFPARPALVIPYFDFWDNPIQFMRDGQKIDYIAIRILDTDKVKSFTVKKMPKYLHLKGSPPMPYIPRCKNLPVWSETMTDKSPLAFVEGELKALRVSMTGLPTIGISGVDCFSYRPKKSNAK